jgi:predicted nucleic acid-binding protein
LILVDTSVWADHFRTADSELVSLIRAGDVWIHEHVLGELAIGNLRDWERTVRALASLPRVPTVSEADWLSCVRSHRLPGSGLGFVDAHLLAAVETEHNLRIWTRDKRLAAMADRMNCKADLN